MHRRRADNRGGPDRGLGRLPARQPRQRARPPRGRRLRRGRARARVRHPRLHLRRGRRPRPRPRLPRRLRRAHATTSRSSTRARRRRSPRSSALLAEEGLSVDVASGGELHIALRAGFDPARIHMHGNNKTEAELRAAVEAGRRPRDLRLVRRDRAPRRDLRRRRARRQRGADPGHARDQGRHPLLRPDRPARLEVRLRARGRARGARGSRPCCAAGEPRLVGLHAHIGSQIFELEPYVKAIEALAELADPDWCRLLNVGGGPRDRLHRGRRAALDRRLRRGQGRGRRARLRPGRRGSWSSPAARWSATPGSRSTRSAP